MGAERRIVGFVEPSNRRFCIQKDLQNMTLRSKGPFHRYANKIESDHFHQRRKIVE